MVEDGIQVGFGNQQQVLVQSSGAFSAQTYLARRLLGGGVQHLVLSIVRARRMRRDVKKQCGLAHTRFAGQQNNRTRYQTVTKNTI